VQLANRANFPPGDAKEDWAILRALSEVMGRPLPYDDIDGVRKALSAQCVAYRSLGMPEQPGADPKIWNGIGDAGQVDSGTALASPIRDFYLTNPIARASETMAECSRLFVAGDLKLAAE
jgi:NADH-quinone oxidoreductase subunit G